MTDPVANSEKPKKTSLWTLLIPVVGIFLLAIGALMVIRSSIAPHSGTELKKGDIAPEMTLHVFGGESISLSDFMKNNQKKIVLINFWATWCEACVTEMPSLIALRERYKNQGFELIAVNLDENPSAVLPKALTDFGIHFPVFLDSSGELSDIFHVHAIPFTVILDSNRKVLWIEAGERNWNSPTIHRLIDQWI